MAIPAEVRRTIKALDKKIKELEETKRRLSEAFGGGQPNVTAAPATPLRAVAAAPRGASLLQAAGLSSVERFETYLVTHGPSTTAAVSEGANIPRGSISWLMRKSNGRIRRREDGLIESAS